MDWKPVLDVVVPVATLLLSGAAVAALVTAIVTWITHTNALKQQRLVETSRLLIDLMALAHARALTDRPDDVGRSEQLGAVRMVGVIGEEYKPLRGAAIEYLEAHAAAGLAADVTATSKVALARLKG